MSYPLLFFKVHTSISAVPTFTIEQGVELRPRNLNITEGHDAVFRCNADAVPEAHIQWYTNGEPFDGEVCYLLWCVIKTGEPYFDVRMMSIICHDSGTFNCTRILLPVASPGRGKGGHMPLL